MNSEKKGIANKNGKGEKSKILFIEKIEVKRKNDIIEVRNNNEKVLSENHTIELFDEIENNLNNENDITTFTDRRKHNYPHSDNDLSKYIIININF